jgi:hypothetical protein
MLYRNVRIYIKIMAAIIARRGHCLITYVLHKFSILNGVVYTIQMLLNDSNKNSENKTN